MLKKTILGFITIAAITIAAMVYYINPTDAKNKKFFIADYQNHKLTNQGEKLYRTNCANCHGIKLQGQENWKEMLPDGIIPAPPHDETGHSWHHADIILFNITKYGSQKSPLNKIPRAMPAFENILDDDEIIAIIAYIKSRWPIAIQERNAIINQRYKMQMQK